MEAFKGREGRAVVCVTGEKPVAAEAELEGRASRLPDLGTADLSAKD